MKDFFLNFGNMVNNPHLDRRKIRKMWKVREIWVTWALLPFPTGHTPCALRVHESVCRHVLQALAELFGSLFCEG